MPLEDLGLCADHARLVKAASDTFGGTERFAAADQLAAKLYLYGRAGGNASQLDVQIALLTALRECWNHCPHFPGEGRPSSRAWVPARAPWPLLMKHLKREVRKHFAALAEVRREDASDSASLSLQAPFGKDENDKPLRVEDVLGREDAELPHEMIALRRRASRAWKRYPQMLRTPSRDWCLEKNEHTGKRIHPALGPFELKEIQAQLFGTKDRRAGAIREIYEHPKERGAYDATGTGSTREAVPDREEAR
jgi:hypothetical protein